MVRASIEQEAVTQVRKLIEGGGLSHHSRLPPERELAKELGVGRSTLRKALGVLEAEGWIARHVGRGTFVGSAPSAGPATAWPPLSSATPLELLEARLVIEPAVAAYAATAAREKDIAHLRSCTEKREAALDPQTYNLWDHAFHRAIAEATQIPLLIGMLEMLNALRHQPDWANYKKQRIPQAHRLSSSREHRQILAAIEQRNPRAAAEAMRLHIISVRESFFARTV